MIPGLNIENYIYNCTIPLICDKKLKKNLMGNFIMGHNMPYCFSGNPKLVLHDYLYRNTDSRLCGMAYDIDHQLS